MNKQYDVVPMTARQFNDFCKRQDSNNEDWSRALFANLLQVSNGKSNTQQVNRSLNLETTRFKNGNLKQQGVAILAYLKEIIDTHKIGVEWRDNRFQYVESVALDIETVIPFHIWQAEAEAKADKAKAAAKAEKAEAEAEAKRLKAAFAASAKAAKAAKAEKAEAEAEAAKALALAEKAETEAEAEKAEAEAEAAEAKAEAAEAKAEAAEAAAEAAEAALKAEQNRLIAAGGSVQAKSLRRLLQRALLAGIQGGSVAKLQAIAKAAGELQIMATGLAMDEKAKVDADAVLSLVEVKPTSSSRKAG